MTTWNRLGIAVSGLSVAIFVWLACSGEAHAADGPRPWTGYVVGKTPAKRASKRAIGRGTVIFFSRAGGKYTLGEPDSRQNIDNIDNGLISPFECGDAKWKQVMACLKDTFLPYGVEVTDVDPGMADHIETVVAGSPGELNQPDGVGGIAPLGCDLAYDNPVAFAFTTPWGCDVDLICWAAAQETAHTVGLDHSTECSDPMTYDRDCSNMKRFRDVAKPCGEDEDLTPNQTPPHPSGARKCQCDGAATQNSHQALLRIFGKRENSAPTVKFARPHEGSVVTAGFPIDLAIDDDFGLASVEITVDGVKVQAGAAPSFHAAAPATLADGEHTVSAHVVDSGGLPGDVTIHVKQEPPCVSNDDCPATAVCQQGSCVDGPGAAGGLGAICTGDGDCGSGRCLPGPDGSRCVEACDLAASTCPMGFDCLSDGVSGSCWPGADVLARGEPSPGGCGCTVGTLAPRASFAAALLALAGVAVALRRRRRR